METEKDKSRKKYYLTEFDFQANYFHFTKKKNLRSIEANGLLPKIGIHAQALEDTKKVFFVEGLDNLLILFDCWINVCGKYPLFPGLFNLGCKIMRYKWFPKFIIRAYFRYTEINKIHQFVAYRYFDHFLKTHVILNLELREGIDFAYNDIDQIKAKGYNKEYLIKAGYSTLYSDLNSNKMDKWNLHTFSNRGIPSSKIKICYIGNSYYLPDILKYALKNTKLNLKEICPILWQYLKSRKWL